MVQFVAQRRIGKVLVCIYCVCIVNSDFLWQ